MSSLPEASILESGDQAIVETPARCPSNVCRWLPVAVSQILMVASAAESSQLESIRSGIYSQQLAIDLPSGENRTAATPLLCPLSTNFCLYGTYCGGPIKGSGGVAAGMLMME